MRILIGDDSSTMRQIAMPTHRRVGDDGADVFEADDGVQGPETLEGSGGELIVSDVNTPNKLRTVLGEVLD